ncbi:hypothetical protein EB001_05020 [bacterium]|nr:hypothetical protein [bacterium]
MKFLKGKNWIELRLGKYNGLYIGPLWGEEKDIAGKYQYKLISFMTRRFKLRMVKDQHTKFWEISMGGLWNSIGTANQYINYDIKVSEFINES